jgi:FkbM family methyltransferase
MAGVTALQAELAVTVPAIEEAPVLCAAATRLLRTAHRWAARAPGARVRRRLDGWLLRARRRLYPPGTRVMGLARLPNGQRAWVNVAEYEGGRRYFGIPHEPAEQALIAALLRPGDVVLDVGAHLGLYALPASRLVGPQGAVHAFEPVAGLAGLLRANAAMNGAANVRVHQVALSDRSGMVDIRVNRESGLSSLAPTGRGLAIGIEPVPAMTLDEAAAAEGIAGVRLLKIDVEGHEAEVLRGAEGLLAREEDLVVLCELEEKNYAPRGRCARDVVPWMAARGFQAWTIDPAQRRLARWGGAGQGVSANVVFAKPDGEADAVLADLEARPGSLR